MLGYAAVFEQPRTRKTIEGCPPRSSPSLTGVPSCPQRATATVSSGRAHAWRTYSRGAQARCAEARDGGSAHLPDDHRHDVLERPACNRLAVNALQHVAHLDPVARVRRPALHELDHDELPRRARRVLLLEHHPDLQPGGG